MISSMHFVIFFCVLLILWIYFKKNVRSVRLWKNLDFFICNILIIHNLCVFGSVLLCQNRGLFTMILFVADFENSSMKNCFSMSSLQSSRRVCLEPSQATNSTPSPVLPNRPYNSLNHKLKLV